MIAAWRITKQKHARTAFKGEGARQFGGRWNSAGKAVVYTAESRALALAEMLVHLDGAAVLPNYVVIRVEIDDAYITDFDVRDLPRNWRAEPAPRRLQMLGDEWIESGRSAVLRVPSVVVPGEFNYLLNPSHPDFKKLRIYGPEKFSVDKRLVR